jgi:hypothetical protein
MQEHKHKTLSNTQEWKSTAHLKPMQSIILAALLILLLLTAAALCLT